MQPTRVVFDPFSDIRHLSRDVLRYRRQVLRLRELFAELQLHGDADAGADACTGEGDLQAEALAHGYITLHQDSAEYGSQRRRLRVHKMRGIPFRDGYHDFAIRTGGLEVYPRLVAADHVEPMPEDDAVERRAGTRRAHRRRPAARVEHARSWGRPASARASSRPQYAVAAARRGETVALFIFDETLARSSTAAQRLGLDLRDLAERGHVRLRQVDAAEFSAGEFTHMVVQAVSNDGASMVVIDSLSGYLNAMPEERFLSSHLHELLTYLSHRNVVTILTLAQHGILGPQLSLPARHQLPGRHGAAAALLRGVRAVRRALSVVKKRSGPHEVSVREMQIGLADLRSASRSRISRACSPAVRSSPAPRVKSTRRDDHARPSASVGLCA